MKMYGIRFEKPIRHISEYLTVLRALLADGNVSHKGELYRVMGFLDVESGGTPPVLLAALHEQMCRTAGRSADGVLPWLAPPSYIADVVVPQVKKGASDAGRDAPPVVAEIPCVIADDFDKVREIANTDLAIYPQMPFYADTLVQAGVPDAADAMANGWTDAMIDAVIPWGDASALGKAVQSYLDAGADEVALSPFGTDTTTAIGVLGDIARS
jgi:alkanesulfonate monooxygenase SsuD/methylene tetrahydromethanopterin reductase-like flavin-dependent oxidoreductase (luciferase family)